MSSAWSQLEQMLTCAICLDKFKNPRLLPCQHSFCGDACMEGLVDYARRQIKCPECRAEHRIPYQGVQSLPSNVTLIRFLELHARITGEEPEPVPTFMEKCSVCGEKIEGVQRCAHCDKKVCPECKEAHIDLLRREINRVNGQTKRCLSKMQEFKETLVKSEERLKVNQRSVRKEIEDSCRRLIDDLQAKQKKLLDECGVYVEQEQKTIDKLKLAIVDELSTLESNCRLAEEKITNKFQWTDQELNEMKEIYAKAMEFVRLFDPEIGDYTRKMRFNLIPEFEAMRRRLCELGELKLAETATSLMASSLQYCNATGSVALEICQAAASQAAAQAATGQAANSQGGYGLSQSNSNSNLGPMNTLELPSMQNALMRSQSDHRLASQFQQRLKQQEAERAAKGPNGSYADRYGRPRDYEADSIRSRYAPPRQSIAGKDYTSDLLRDWPRPGDNDSDLYGGSSGTHFKSAFMRRREKERQQYSAGAYSASSYNRDDEDDDLISEASYGGMSVSGRSVRFYDPSGAEQAGSKQVPRVFDCKAVEHGPLSGVPKLEESPHLLERLHQMGAKAIVDKRLAEEEGKRDKDLMDSARLTMSKARQRQKSEDEVEKQKRANKLEEEAAAIAASNTIRENHSPTPAGDLNSSASTVIEAEPASGTSSTSQQQPATPPSPVASSAGGRRSLYGQAVNEKSKRQLSDAIQSAEAYRTRRKSTVSIDSPETPATPEATNGRNSPVVASTSGRPKRTLRSSGRSLSKQASVERQQSVDGGSTPQSRRRVLARADTSQQSVGAQSAAGSQLESSGAANNSSTNLDEQSKNVTTGSGGNGDSTSSQGTAQKQEGPLMAGRQQQQQTSRGSKFSMESQTSSTATTADQTSATTDEVTSDNDESFSGMDTIRRRAPSSRQQSSEAPMRAFRKAFSSRRGVTGSSSVMSDRSDRFGRTATTELSDDGEDVDGQAVEETRNEREEDEENVDEREGDGGSASSGHTAASQMLPTAMNRLLDRSAQIRRDNLTECQDQVSRGNSPQRGVSSPVRVPEGGQSSFFSPARSGAQTTGYSSSPGSSSPATANSASRQRLTYQRSHSIRDEEDSNSNNSLYTTASSGSGIRRPSVEDEQSTTSRRRTSGNSSDRTLVSEYERPSTYQSPKRDSSETNTGFQSRFLARSRTSAALSGGNGSESGGQRSQESETGSGYSSRQQAEPAAGRSYLSSRDRFMQSASLMSSASDQTASSSSAAPARGSSSYYTRGSSVAKSSPASSSAEKSSSFSLYAGPVTKHPLIQKYLYWPFGEHTTARKSSSNNSNKLANSSSDTTYAPNSSYSTSNKYNGSSYDSKPTANDSSSKYARLLSGRRRTKTHSEYPKNKFGRRSSSQSSTSSAALMRSRSSHSGFSFQNSDDDDSDMNLDNDVDKSYGSRRASVVRGSFDSTSSSGRNVYSLKGCMLFKLGTRGGNPGNFTWPRGVAVGMGARGREIVVADSSNHRVQVFDASGRFMNEFGCYGSEPGEFDCLAGVAISRYNKNYIVSDRYNHRVQIFDMSGKFVRSFGEMGRETGKFNLPWGVAVDSSGQIYVCDKENHRIQVFDRDGNYLSKFGVFGSQPGQLQHPHYIAVGAAGKIIVTDTNNHRVQIFDSSGRLLSELGREGSGNGQFKFPRGVAVDEQGFIIVGDSGNNRLQIFGPDGLFVKSIGTWGSAKGEFKGIEGVAVDSNYNILVCDRENHRIQVF